MEGTGSGRNREWREQGVEETGSGTHAAEDDFLLLGVLHGVRVVGDPVALGFDLVPGGAVLFLPRKSPKKPTSGQR